MTTPPTTKDDRLEILIDQIGRLSEVHTEFKYEMIERLDRLIQMAEEQAAVAKEQAAIAREQKESIARLAATAEQNAATAGRHEDNITRLVAVVERQAQVVEALIQERQR